MKILVTGAAGFIGFHLARQLIKRGDEVVGYDVVNSYYDPKYKRARLLELEKTSSFVFYENDLCDRDALQRMWDREVPRKVVHLAAQAGVRYSLENPMAYIDSNVVGFQNIIDMSKNSGVENFVYASSSSVYGGNKKLPFDEAQDVSHPISLYAATKISNELVARTYAHLFQLPTTGLRFFTAYGPFGRPDMAMFKFATLMRQGRPIPVFNHGDMVRDFTYVDDIIEGVIAANDRPQLDKVYNLGKGSPEKLLDMIAMLEDSLGVNAEKQLLPMQPGDVPENRADYYRARADLEYDPKISLEEGIKSFVDWYKEFHNI